MTPSIPCDEDRFLDWVLASVGIKEEQARRTAEYEQAQALAACGFATRDGQLINETGAPLNDDELKRFAHELLTIVAERKARVAAARAEVNARRAALEAEKQKAYNAVAAPLREERRRRKAAAFARRNGVVGVDFAAGDDACYRIGVDAMTKSVVSVEKMERPLGAPIELEAPYGERVAEVLEVNDLKPEDTE
jgi:hypothetical protein